MDPTASPANPQRPRSNWWTRNWKWFVPTGCLSILAIGAAFIFLIFFVVFATLKSSDTYKTALATATSDTRVISSLGSPIESGFFVSGSTNVSGASGKSDLSIPISGPKAKGTIYVVATKEAGEWSYSKLIVEVDKTGERIDLTKKVSQKK